MKKIISKILPVLLISFLTTVQAQEARTLISQVVEANGGQNALHQLKDVSFDYTFEVKDNNVVDVSNERYIFDKEVSFAHYTKRQIYALPQMPGDKYTHC